MDADDFGGDAVDGVLPLIDAADEKFAFGNFLADIFAGFNGGGFVFEQLEIFHADKEPRVGALILGDGPDSIALFDGDLGNDVFRAFGGEVMSRLGVEVGNGFGEFFNPVEREAHGGGNLLVAVVG